MADCSGSWKSRVIRALYCQDVQTLNALLDQNLPQEPISIIYADDCVHCYRLDGSVGLSEEALAVLCGMADRGHCECSEHGTETLISFSLLHLASLVGLTAAVSRLLQAGYHANELSQPDQLTPLQLVASDMQLKEAAAIATVLIEGEASVNVRDGSGNTPLHLAVRTRREGLAEVLIRSEACDLDLTNDEGETALFWAVKLMLQSTTALLVNAGCDINIKNKRDCLPLNIAILCGRMLLIQALLKSEGCDPNISGTTSNNSTHVIHPLFIATARGNPRVVRLLLEKGAFVDCLDSHDRQQPLLVAAYNNHQQVAHMLLAHGANVNLAPRQGYTALHQAAWEGHTDMCRLLLEHGSHHDTQTQDKNTPLALACHGGFTDTAQLLLSHSCNVNNQDKDQDTPLLYCTFNCSCEGVALMLQHGANPDLENTIHVTPLWNAVFAGDKTSVQRLIQCNVRLSVASRGIDQHAHSNDLVMLYEELHTPLYVACTRSNQGPVYSDLAVSLILAGVDLRHEPWFWSGNLPVLLTNNGALLHWITQHATHPTSLLRLCRAALRRLLGVNPHSIVDALDIPNVLKDFLLIRNFERDI